ncbi:MAG: hypothetical protein ACP5RN_14530 [Armatimonadota bacterium]
MNKPKVMLWVLGLVIVIAIAVVTWSLWKTDGGKITAEEARKATAIEQQIGAVQSNPNVPPQVKQWLEYNLQQRRHHPADSYPRGR